MREFIETHFSAAVIRWDEFDGDNFLFEVIFQGEVIRADNPALILRALVEKDRREPRGKIIYLPATPGFALGLAA